MKQKFLAWSIKVGFISMWATTTAFAQGVNVEQLVANQPALKKGQEVCVHHNFAGMPQLNFGPENNAALSKRLINLCRMGYYAVYDPVTRTPLWVAENLDKSRPLPDKDVIGDFFTADPDLPANIAQGNAQDYKGTPFAPAHLAPAEDMNSRAPTQEQRNTIINQSLYFTNLMPLVGENLDKGMWLSLEKQIREWAKTRENLLVVTGPIYDKPTQPLTIGANKVWVPSRIYKVVFDSMTGKSIAFVIPNVQIVSSSTKRLDPGSPQYPQTTDKLAYNCGKVCSLANFRTSVAEVEKITHLKFFPNAKSANFSVIDSRAWPLAY